jgi:uncharacterized membrane protein (Fun14 family)
MTTIPEACMQYTSVFATMKLEAGICVVVGIAIGYFMKDR